MSVAWPCQAQRTPWRTLASNADSWRPRRLGDCVPIRRVLFARAGVVPAVFKCAYEEDGCCSNEEISTDKKIDYSILKDFQFDFFAVHFLNETPEFFGKTFCFYSNKKNVDYYCNSNAPPFYKLYSQLIFYA